MTSNLDLNSITGLSEAESAPLRLAAEGYNELPSAKPRSNPCSGLWQTAKQRTE